MAVKSIIEVDVDEGGFKAFNALYEKYQANLAKASGLRQEKKSSPCGRDLRQSPRRFSPKTN
jgi:hypothetical protein